MLALRRVFAVISLSSLCLLGLAAAQPSDQDLAERVLGPQWKQLSRHAGMIFAGTVLTTMPQSLVVDRTVPGAVPAVQLRFRVDEAIAGVERGQILTIHEWAGARSMQRPMSSGQHILIFLYPPSRLGLTSPVGGSLGQVALDSTGASVSNDAHKRDAPRPRTAVASDRASVSVLELERAIRSARREQE